MLIDPLDLKRDAKLCILGIDIFNVKPGTLLAHIVQADNHQH